jgi:hypothetical protein
MREKDRIARALRSVLDTDVEVERAHDGGDYRVRVPALAGEPQFAAAWIRRGWPAEVRAQLDRSPGLTLLVAPEFSSGARRLLDDHAINWVDEAGAASLRAPNLLVRIDRGPAPKDPQPHAASWSASSLLAAEAVLAHRPAQITTAWIAEHAGCSIPRAGAILTAWDREQWTAKEGPARGRGAHRVLAEPGAMLASWTAHLNAAPLERWFGHTTGRDLEALTGQLGDVLRDWSFAWTGWVAVGRLAPYLTQLPVLHLRVDERYTSAQLAPSLRAAGVTLTEDAGRIEFWRTAADALRLAMPSPVGPIASWPRVYADLQRLGGRGHDAAEHLREVMEAADG